MSCRQLARAGLFLAAGGRDPSTGHSVVRPARARRINALMLTCGHYDGSGDFAYQVGLPGKSGVGGGILAVAPGHASIAVWSPGLNQIGNSLLGTVALELLTRRTGWSVFGLTAAQRLRSAPDDGEQHHRRRWSRSPARRQSRWSPSPAARTGRRRDRRRRRRPTRFSTSPCPRSSPSRRPSRRSARRSESSASPVRLPIPPRSRGAQPIPSIPRPSRRPRKRDQARRIITPAPRREQDPTSRRRALPKTQTPRPVRSGS